MTQVMLALIGLFQQELGAGLRYAGRYVIGIAPTDVANLKGRMLGVQTWREHSENSDRGMQVTGHQWMLGGLLAKVGERWRCFPVWLCLVSGKQHPSHFVVSPTGAVHPMSIWETVIAMVAQAASMVTGAPVYVVMGAYFAKACMCTPLIEMGITLLTRLRHDNETTVGSNSDLYLRD
jgi:hypothetical protein